MRGQVEAEGPIFQEYRSKRGGKDANVKRSQPVLDESTFTSGTWRAKARFISTSYDVIFFVAMGASAL